MRLHRETTTLVVIDVQDGLMPAMERRLEVETNIDRLIRGCHILGIPTIVTEQYKKGLGPTVEPLRRALEETGGYRPLEKTCFSAYGCAGFEKELRRLERNQVIVAGVETHVCVYQTVVDLLREEYDVTIIGDAVSSRTAQNRAIALERMTNERAKLSSTEMALFELLVRAASDEFRAISKLVK